MNKQKLFGVILIIIGVILLSITLSSCNDNSTKEDANIPIKINKRITLIENTEYLMIYKVDSIEYLVNYHGGIIKLK